MLNSWKGLLALEMHEKSAENAPLLPDAVPDVLPDVLPDSTVINSRRGIAPVWHTAVLVVAIVLLSFAGAKSFSAYLDASHHGNVDRLLTYAHTAGMEALMVVWVWFGLRLRGVPFRSLIGQMPRGVRGVMQDIGVALVFWIASLCVLGTVGAAWLAAEAAIEHRPLVQAGQTVQTSAQQKKTVQDLSVIAPQSGAEVAGWILLCLFVGFAEEVVFRGYLQQQFTAWAKGAAAAGVVFSALMFGCAHGYEGVRNMVLLAVFGALFSLLAIFRRGLRAGMMAHAWQDLLAGLTLAFLKSRGIL
jgi:uncharacterized protein